MRDVSLMKNTFYPEFNYWTKHVNSTVEVWAEVGVGAEEVRQRELKLHGRSDRVKPSGGGNCNARELLFSGSRTSIIRHRTVVAHVRSRWRYSTGCGKSRFHWLVKEFLFQDFSQSIQARSWQTQSFFPFIGNLKKWTYQKQKLTNSQNERRATERKLASNSLKFLSSKSSNISASFSFSFIEEFEDLMGGNLPTLSSLLDNTEVKTRTFWTYLVKIYRHKGTSADAQSSQKWCDLSCLSVSFKNFTSRSWSSKKRFKKLHSCENFQRKHGTDEIPPID